MEAYAILKKACTPKGLTRLADLPAGEYLVREFSLVETRYGSKLKLDLGDQFVILPSSRSKGLDETSVASLNTIRQLFVWVGYGSSQFES